MKMTKPDVDLIGTMNSLEGGTIGVRGGSRNLKEEGDGQRPHHRRIKIVTTMMTVTTGDGQEAVVNHPMERTLGTGKVIKTLGDRGRSLGHRLIIVPFRRKERDRVGSLGLIIGTVRKVGIDLKVEAVIGRDQGVDLLPGRVLVAEEGALQRVAGGSFSQRGQPPKTLPATSLRWVRAIRVLNVRSVIL